MYTNTWNWRAWVFLGVVHILGFGGIFHGIFYAPFETNMFALARYILCMLAITAGYHRLYAHESYKCASMVQYFFAIFGGMSFQYKIADWVKDHRPHHWYTDTDKDPHNIKRGFFWAHIGCWLSLRPRTGDEIVSDLYRNKIVCFQGKHYRLITILCGIILPCSLPILWGDFYGWLVMSTSLLVQFHATYSVNSVAHMLGEKPYNSNESGTNNFWVTLVTLGEGEQNYHHKNPQSWHNGIWFDPTGWFIWTLSKFRLAWDLK